MQSWPMTWRIYYLGAAYYRYHFPGGQPHVVIQQGGINLYNCG